MNTVFKICRHEKAASFFKRFFKKSELSSQSFSIGMGSITVFTLHLYGKITKQKEEKIIRRAFQALYANGIRKIILDKTIDRELLNGSGLKLQNGRSINILMSDKLVLKALLENEIDLKTAQCTVFALRLNSSVKSTIAALAEKVRYISVSCGKDTENIKNWLLFNYGVSTQDVFAEYSQRVLVLFSHVPKRVIWQANPQLVIDFTDELADYGVKTVNSAEYCIYNAFFEENIQQFKSNELVSGIVENGLIKAEKIEILKIKYKK